MNYQDIKFKVWDGERLTNVNSIGWTDGEIDWIDTPKYSGPIQEDMKIFQYTGVKDEGIEVYEGYIIDFEFSGEIRRGVVEFKRGIFQIRTKEKIGNQNIAHTFGESSSRNRKVIGHICENPELLEDTNIECRG